MNKQVIKDNLNRPIGWIVDTGRSREAYDALNRKQATYDKATNQTRDILGRVRSYGDTLAQFIK